MNGTSRLNGATTFPNSTTINGSGNLSIGAFTLHGGFGFATFSQTTLLLTGGTFTSTSGNQIGLSFGGGFAPTSGTATYSAYSILPTINQTGGANGITRGIHINPTLTAAADFRAIETTSGSVIFNHGSTPLMFISSSGNVGIGTTTPSFPLDVNGIVRLSTIYFNGAALTGNITATSTSLEFNSPTSFGLFNFNCNGGGRRVSINGTASDTTGNDLLSIPFVVQNTTGTGRNFSMLNINPTINNTAAYTGTVRGFYYNPTITSLTGTILRQTIVILPDAR